MTWQDNCNSPLSRYRASREDDDLNDATFSVDGVVMKANRAILALVSPVLKTLFYGFLAVKMGVTVTIDDGTERGFKAMLEFIYNEGEYSAKDLLGGKEEITEWEDVEKVLELIYFAHKYQINSLVSFGRDLLLQGIKINTDNVMKIHREIVAYKTILNSEYSIVNYATKEFIGSQFVYIFKQAKVTTEVFLPEDMMVEVLKKKSMGNTNFIENGILYEYVSEGFVLQVALDYVRYCQDIEQKAKGKKINPEDLAKRIITEVIDFTKLTLDEVDLTEISAFLPAEMQTAMITSYKNGLRKPVYREENPTDCTISLAKMPLQQLQERETSQIKFKVDKSCFILFNGQLPSHGYNPYNQARRFLMCNHYGQDHPNACKQIVWKQSGSLKQVVTVEADSNVYYNECGSSKLVVTKQVNSHKFFAEPNVEVTVDFEMQNNNITYALDNDNGKFKKGDIELTVLEVNGELIGEEATGEKAQRGGKKNQDTASNKCLHVVNFTILPM